MTFGFGMGFPRASSASGGSSLDLQFAGATTLNPLITFIRPSTGTYFDAAGVLQSAAVNLVTYSQDFSNVAWTKLNSSITSDATVAPDGTLTADRLVENTATSTHSTTQTFSVTSGTAVTLSVFVKSTERFLALGFSPNATFGGTGAGGFFNISSGTVQTTFGTVTALISAAGNGWYRCSITSTPTATGTATAAIGLSASGTATTYTGNGTSGLFIWGAQVQVGSVATTYIQTFNTVGGAPRFDYDPSTLAAQGLLIEEARTNLVLNSATLVTQNITVTAVAHTLSFYGTGTVALSGAFTGSLVGSGAFPTRSTLTFTPAAGTLTLTVTGSVTQAQVEAGAFATSYIPTTAAAATRARDDAYISTLTPWYNQSEGTLFATVGYRQASPTFQAAASFNDNTANNRWTTGFTATSSVGTALRNTGGVGLISTLTANAAIVGATNKIALAISTGCSLVLNGGTVATNASYAAPTVTQLQIGNQLGAGYLNGYLRTLTYYPRRLSNAELQALTT